MVYVLYSTDPTHLFYIFDLLSITDVRSKNCLYFLSNWYLEADYLGIYGYTKSVEPEQPFLCYHMNGL